MAATIRRVSLRYTHENADLISHQRVAKSASASGSVQTVWWNQLFWNPLSRHDQGTGVETPEQTNGVRILCQARH
jgi:hypothetical protein